MQGLQSLIRFHFTLPVPPEMCPVRVQEKQLYNRECTRPQFLTPASLCGDWLADTL
jgi:hypothetical protein